MSPLSVFPEKVLSIGPVEITDTVIISWFIMAVIGLCSYLLARRLSIEPSLHQEVLESIFEATEKTVTEVVPVNPWLAIPVLGTFWIFIAFSNLIGLLPGLKTPTADINTTFAFALISYSMTHVFGILTLGVREYLAHYKEPSWILLPMHIMAEITRTVALAVRLFGNMLSGDMIAVILIGVVGLLVPVPFGLLHVVIGLIQAYIFGVLTLVFIAGGIRIKTEKED